MMGRWSAARDFAHAHGGARALDVPVTEISLSVVAWRIEHPRARVSMKGHDDLNREVTQAPERVKGWRCSRAR
jgi:hypothetical protein